jgi:hypothetical protein
MKKSVQRVEKSIVYVVCLAMMFMLFSACSNAGTKKVTVTFIKGEETLGTVQTDAGTVLNSDSYAAYEEDDNADFLGWFKTPTYLEASRVDLETATFEEDTTLYGCFQSNNVTKDTRKWYIVGTSSCDGVLKDTNWADPNADDQVKQAAQLTATQNATNEFTITLDLYAGDQFQLVPDWSWDGQLGFGYMKEYDATQVKNGGGLSGSDDTSNITVLQDGNYTITLTTNPDDEALTTFVIVRNGDPKVAPSADEADNTFEITKDTNVKVKGSWVDDWSELKDLTQNDDGTWSIEMNLSAGTELYFSIFDGDTDTGFGLKAENVTDEASKALLEESENVKVASDGVYTFTVDLAANTITVKKE